MKRSDIKREVKKFKNRFFRSMRNSNAESKIPQIIFGDTVILVNHLVELGTETVLEVRAELNNLVTV